MRLIVVILLAATALAACLPNVSRQFSEVEARAILEREVLTLCKSTQSSSGLAGILSSVDAAQATPTRDHWIFRIAMPESQGDLEALVFPSRVVAGSYIRHVQTRSCR